MKNNYNRGKKCSVAGCSHGARCKGMCMKHYSQMVMEAAHGRPCVSTQ